MYAKVSYTYEDANDVTNEVIVTIDKNDDGVFEGNFDVIINNGNGLQGHAPDWHIATSDDLSDAIELAKDAIIDWCGEDEHDVVTANFVVEIEPQAIKVTVSAELYRHVFDYAANMDCTMAAALANLAAIGAEQFAGHHVPALDNNWGGARPGAGRKSS